MNLAVGFRLLASLRLPGVHQCNRCAFLRLLPQLTNRVSIIAWGVRIAFSGVESWRIRLLRLSSTSSDLYSFINSKGSSKVFRDLVESCVCDAWAHFGVLAGAPIGRARIVRRIQSIGAELAIIASATAKPQAKRKPSRVSDSSIRVCAVNREPISRVRRLVKCPLAASASHWQCEISTVLITLTRLDLNLFHSHPRSDNSPGMITLSRLARAPNCPAWLTISLLSIQKGLLPLGGYLQSSREERVSRLDSAENLVNLQLASPILWFMRSSTPFRAGPSISGKSPS